MGWLDWEKGSLVGYPAGERFLGKTTETLGRCGSVSLGVRRGWVGWIGKRGA